ncbi:MAG TPA: hypothetical protein VNW90_25810 [Acetobacteraceae bacterium]|jgi:hypothetical protein|nr:hypothetical protein [Acetobacteraceae bacterium]
MKVAGLLGRKLKALALMRHVAANDLILEFIANGLALNGRRAAV